MESRKPVHFYGSAGNWWQCEQMVVTEKVNGSNQIQNILEDSLKSTCW